MPTRTPLTRQFAHVNTTVVTLNETINRFYDGVVQVVNGTFGNTPLAAASLGLINCLIGRKVAGISNGLTFISECVCLVSAGLTSQPRARHAAHRPAQRPHALGRPDGRARGVGLVGRHG